LENVIKLHGFPKSVVSDRDRVFTSAFWKELFTMFDTKLLRSTAYHPQTDGQSERVNQCLEMYLRCSVQESPKHWKSWLPLAEIWYSTSYHTALGCSPFKALYGNEHDSGMILLVDATLSSEAVEWIKERSTHMLLLKEHLLKAQNRMKLQADRQRSDRSFQVGDQVLLKLQPYAQTSLVNRPFPKLAFKYFGPFEVLQRIGQTAYKLKLPEGSQVHPVFHVSQLKPFVANYTPVYSDFSSLVDLSAVDLQPEVILQRRLVKKGSKAIPQVLVKWTKLPEASATWEDWYVLKTRFPSVVTCGQARSPGGKMSRLSSMACHRSEDGKEKYVFIHRK
jgi:hypothetical protein